MTCLCRPFAQHPDCQIHRPAQGPFVLGPIVEVMDDTMIEVVERYVGRCRRAGDERDVRTLLEEIVHPGLAVTLARGYEQRWVV